MIVGIVLFCTLGVGVSDLIGLSMVALLINEGTVVFDMGTVVLGIGLISCGGAVASSKVTH